ncbi:MAG: hypothetical protein ACXWD3_18785, partial [Mycobacterium sp.]
MGRAQSLLSKERWSSVDFAAILNQELAPFPTLKATCTGPSVPLGPGMAQTLSLIIHELATNSVKYGAMGESDGQVFVVWDLQN